MFGKYAAAGRRFLGRPPLPAADFRQLSCDSSHPIFADVTSEMKERNNEREPGRNEGERVLAHSGSAVGAAISTIQQRSTFSETS